MSQLNLHANTRSWHRYRSPPYRNGILYPLFICLRALRPSGLISYCLKFPSSFFLPCVLIATLYYLVPGDGRTQCQKPGTKNFWDNSVDLLHTFHLNSHLRTLQVLIESNLPKLKIMPNKCGSCGLSVNFSQAYLVSNTAWHADCFKCSVCDRQ